MFDIESRHIEIEVKGRRSDDEVFERDGDALSGLLSLDLSGKLSDLK